MLGEYIGQFLPLSGGTLTGALSLGGNDLDYIANIKDNTGNPRIQIINTGSDRALSLLDDLGNVVATVNEEGLTVDGEFTLAANVGTSIDGIGDLYGDGGGNLTIDSKTFLLNATATGSSGTIDGAEILSTFSLSGSVTAIGTVLGASFNGSTTGKKYIASFRDGIDYSFVDTTGNFVKSSFTAAQAIYVDGTNGSDLKGNGTDLGPYQTITHALSVATLGQCVVVGPGNYNVAQVVCPNGVSLVGSGMDITTLTCTGSNGQGPCVIVGTGTVVSDLTINSATGQNIPPIGFQAQAIRGSTQTSTLFYLRRIRAIGNVDSLYLSYGALAIGSTTYTCEDCWFTSFYDTVQHVVNAGGSFNFTFLRCHLLPVYNGTSGTLRCLTGGGTGNISGYCEDTEFKVTDASTAPNNGVFIQINTEVKGCRFVQNTPNLSQAFISPNAAQVDEGNTFVAILSGGISISEVPQSASSPAIASSAATPALAKFNEVAIDAATLSSNTLTINAPSWNPIYNPVIDLTEITLRIGNSNAASTAMTLSLASGYNAGGWLIPAIAPGASLYLTFRYDAGNSEWILIACSPGVPTLPLSGGTMVGSISLGGHNLTGVSNIVAASEGTLQFCAPDGTPACQIIGESYYTGFTFPPNIGFYYDGNASTTGDGNGNVSNAVTTFLTSYIEPQSVSTGSFVFSTINPGYTLSGSAATTDLAIVPDISGTSTGAQLSLSGTNGGANTWTVSRTGLFPGLGFAPATQADLTGKTAAVSSVVSYAPPSTGTFKIGAYVTITAIATDVLEVEVTYTDEASANRTIVLVPMGATAGTLSAVGAYLFPDVKIRVYGGTTITVKTILSTGGGSITYDVGADISQAH
jgi:hypothetical protein